MMGWLPRLEMDDGPFVGANLFANRWITRLRPQSIPNCVRGQGRSYERNGDAVRQRFAASSFLQASESARRRQPGRGRSASAGLTDLNAGFDRYGGSVI